MVDSIDVVALGGDLPEEEPGTDRPAEQLAWQLRWQALACARMDASLYALLLERAADDVLGGGPCARVLGDHVAPGRGDAIGLRFMAAVHRVVLAGDAPALAALYPSAGGAVDPAVAWPVFRDTVEAHADRLRADVAAPCQTNEVGRAAGLAVGFLALAAAGLPFDLREIGASAGLNLRWDRFRYGGGGAAWGPPDSPVDLSGHWTDAPGATADVVVAERRGCDLRPVDPATEEGRLLLRSAVWADQPDRLARLDGALAIAAAVPATVDAAAADAWLGDVLRPQPGVCTVVYHSVVEEYLPAGDLARLHATIAARGRDATAGAPLAWLRLEPVSRLRRHAVTLTTWPGGDERVLATCGPHGADVRRPAPIR